MEMGEDDLHRPVRILRGGAPELGDPAPGVQDQSGPVGQPYLDAGGVSAVAGPVGARRRERASSSPHLEPHPATAEASAGQSTTKAP